MSEANQDDAVRSTSTNDDAVRSTNDDASSCKRAAIHLGYWKDPYITYFIRASERKAPEINRGFYARVQGIHNLLKKFLEITQCKGQIINLGAGFDTTFWNLKDEDLAPTNFIEVDFQGVIQRKTYYIQQRKTLLQRLAENESEVTFIGTDLHSPQYHVVSADLRNLSELKAKLSQCNIDYSIPTCFLTECVLIYMPADASTNLIKWVPQEFSTAFFLNYEQVNMGDRFGQVMLKNLRGRGCSLPGIEHCLTLETHKQRFLRNGWETASAINMVDVYRSLPQDDVQSFCPSPCLTDLGEELFAHYCLVWAFSGELKQLSKIIYDFNSDVVVIRAASSSEN